MIHKLKENGTVCIKDDITNKYGYYNVDKNYITSLLNNVSYPYNPKFDAESISKFISNYKGFELNKWDIVFISGSGNNKDNVFEGINIKTNMRKYDTKQTPNGKIIRISGSKARLGNPGDPKFGLNFEKIRIAEKEFENQNKNSNSINNKYYFISEIKRNPLLMIYLIDLKDDEKNTTNIKENIIGLGIGIPNLTDEATKFAIYKVNKIYFELSENDDYGDEE